MEIAIKGAGDVTVRFIDRKGRTLVQEKLTVSGSPTVEAKQTISLMVETTDGQVMLAPVLVHQSNPEQQVTFDGQKPSAFTKKRCEEIGCPSNIIEDAERGCVQPLQQDEVLAFVSGDQELIKLLQTVKQRNDNEKIEP
jgi:hypothetical protein